MGGMPFPCQTAREERMFQALGIVGVVGTYHLGGKGAAIKRRASYRPSWGILEV